MSWFIGPKDCCKSKDFRKHERWCRYWGQPATEEEG